MSKKTTEYSTTSSIRHFALQVLVGVNPQCSESIGVNVPLELR